MTIDFTRARAVKVSAFLAHIPIGATSARIAAIADEHAAMTRKQQLAVAKAAGCRAPSAETWALVVEGLRARAPDPFGAAIDAEFADTDDGGHGPACLDHSGDFDTQADMFDGFADFEDEGARRSPAPSTIASSPRWRTLPPCYTPTKVPPRRFNVRGRGQPGWRST
jgi:hypothetical protein